MLLVSCAAAIQIGTPLCVPSKGSIELGRIASLELNHKAVDVAHVGQSVAMKIEAGNAMEQSRMFGRHFDHTDQLVSKISRESINALKAHFADEMSKDDWRLVSAAPHGWRPTEAAAVSHWQDSQLAMPVVS